MAGLALVGLIIWRIYHPLPAPEEFPFESDGRFVVMRVIDGDTLLLSDQTIIRLIGVDTPETKHPERGVEPYGKEATAYTRNVVEGRTVRLSFDRERKDKYGRVLAYVYVDDKLLNESILRAGWGRSLTQFPYSTLMKKRMIAAEQAAREAGRGIWQ